MAEHKVRKGGETDYEIGTVKRLRTEFVKRVQEIQDTCSHATLSEPVPYMWALGHFSHMVRICQSCDKDFRDDAAMPPWTSEVSVRPPQ